MEKVPTGCGSDLRTILGFFKNESKFRSVNKSFQRLDFAPNSRNKLFCQPKLRPVDHNDRSIDSIALLTGLCMSQCESDIARCVDSYDAIRCSLVIL